MAFIIHGGRGRGGGVPPMHIKTCNVWSTARLILTIACSILTKVSQVSFLFFCLHFQVQHVHLEDHHVVRKRSINQNIRIKLYYDDSVFK
jgi:hypothetical protein